MARSIALILAVAALGLGAAGTAWSAPPPPFDARAVMVVDGRNGEVLFAQNERRRLPMASITKLMTALVTLERARPSELVTVRSSASVVGESTVNLRTGERLKVRDLLAAALIQSANDAAYALAAHVGKGNVDAFVRLMNDKAKRLGMTRTHYVRPDGLDTFGHVSSARDTIRLARAAMRKPLIRDLVRRQRAKIAGGRTLFSWNDLLGSVRGLVGVKTGHTTNAGWCQVAAARRGGLAVYAVVLGGPSRAQRNEDLAELLDWGFDQFRRVTLVQPGRVFASAEVPMSERPVGLVAAERADEVVRVGHSLVEQVIAPWMVELPVSEGERLGVVRIFDGRKLLTTRPLVATRAVPEPSLGDRVGWYAGRAFEEATGMLDGLFAFAQ